MSRLVLAMQWHKGPPADKMKTKSLIKIIIIASIILKASISYALDMDYYTWNGFDIEVEAWRILTLIFADNGYKTLFLQ